MWSMNLLILMAIIFAYFFLGGGVYMAICVYENETWNDDIAIWIILFWPLVLLGILPLIFIKVVKIVWVKIVSAAFNVEEEKGK